MRALITNDDGIDSPGLAALAAAAVDAGLEVVIAAPAHEHSGASASIIATQGTAVTAAGGKGTVRSERRTVTGHDGEAYAVHAAPAAGQGGVRALAVSLDVGLRDGGAEHWETAAAVAGRALPGLLRAPAGTVHNVNVPDVPMPPRCSSWGCRWRPSASCRPP